MPLAEIAKTFGVDWPHLLAQSVSFAIVCALLYRFAYRPVLKMLDLRRQQIAQGLENTDKINARLKAIDDERQKVIVEAQTEAVRIVATARDTAKKLTEQETLHARMIGQQMMRRARDAAEQERGRMMADVRRDVTHLVVETTAAVAGKVLTDDDQRRLASEAARRIA
jgi:F-type H+-transporting ATPase subunit b